MIGYTKSFKKVNISLLIKEDELLQKYHKSLDKVNNNIKNYFIVNQYAIKRFKN